MPSIPIFCVDAFTDTPFTGNPAAICVLPSDQPDIWMQSLAAEMNLSETAFVKESGKNIFNLRWFTPTVEVDLCGHATLASAFALWEKGYADKNEPIGFDTRSGRLTAELTAKGVTLDFPLVSPEPCEEPAGLFKALRQTPQAFMKAGSDYLVELCCADHVRTATPDFFALSKIPMRGVIVTAGGDEPDVDFVSRFFAPAVGINEDPVTGSAHCALGPYWMEKTGKNILTARQVSKRGGTVYVEVKNGRVSLTGKAVMVWEGSIRRGDS
ncbi:MAG: PhzF family phenazine biosynthesis protein [Nitrospinae bacterium]|nr:PhzF family phenazine biosynthesis protein [Nitrospinota bacterium]